MKKGYPLSAAVILALAAGTTQAALVLEDQETQNLPNETNITLNLSQFNGSVNDLTNVYVELELRLNGMEIALDNDADQAQEGTAHVLNTANSVTSTVNFLKTDLDTINTSDLTINASQVFNLTATSGDTVGQFDATGNGDYALWTPNTLTNGDSGNIHNSAWTDYVGSGDFSITINTTYLTSATFEGNDGYFQGNTPNGEVYAKVIYTYVPEPATLGPLALLGFIGLRKRHCTH
jgi:hypothetical protein